MKGRGKLILLYRRYNSMHKTQQIFLPKLEFPAKWKDTKLTKWNNSIHKTW